jgi:hypothetical protein
MQGFGNSGFDAGCYSVDLSLDMVDARYCWLQQMQCEKSCHVGAQRCVLLALFSNL